MVVHCFKSTGQAVAPIPPDMKETVMEESSRAGLADDSRGVISVVLLGEDYHVVVDLNDNWGESEFTLTLNTAQHTMTQSSSHGGVEPSTNVQEAPTPAGQNWPQRSLPMWQWQKFDSAASTGPKPVSMWDTAEYTNDMTKAYCVLQNGCGPLAGRNRKLTSSLSSFR